MVITGTTLFSKDGRLLGHYWLTKVRFNGFMYTTAMNRAYPASFKLCGWLQAARWTCGAAKQRPRGVRSCNI